MSDKLVSHLRQISDAMKSSPMRGVDFVGQAADRIEQLEAALCVIVKARENKPENCSDEYLVWCCIDIARAALAGEKKDE
jgi:hypothetical protein